MISVMGGQKLCKTPIREVHHSQETPKFCFSLLPTSMSISQAHQLQFLSFIQPSNIEFCMKNVPFQLDNLSISTLESNDICQLLPQWWDLHELQVR